MDILLIFNEKPRNASKELAIKLASECEFINEKERYKVVFHEIDPAFNKLLSICGKWSTTQLFIDNKEYKAQDILDIFNCFMKSRCNGLCFYINRWGFCDYNNLFGLIGLVTESGMGYQHHIDNFKNTVIGLDFIKKIDDNTYLLNKEELKNKIFEESELPLTFCQAISKDKIINKIELLPEKIQIKQRTRDDIQSDMNREIPKYRGMSEYDKAYHREIAEIMAPIFAKEIKKEIMNLMIEIGEASEKDKKP